jgi:GntR family transcriptional regulator, transcriptional repressor for pyruvate dehydrogenase complex
MANRMDALGDPLPNEPPRIPRMAEIVAARLRHRIINGELDDGDELPREADLLEEFGVSRPSLREAIRILETEGLLRIRRGKIGGGIVKRPTPSSAAYHLGLSLQSNGTTLDDVAAARSVLEPVCAGLIAALPKAKRAKVIKQLSDLVDENERALGESYEFTSTALSFHAAVVELCDNTTIMILTSALEAVWSSQERQWAEQATAEGGYPNRRYQREVLKAHRRIITFMSDGDVDGATRAMREHLTKSQPYVNYHDARIEVLGTRE